MSTVKIYHNNRCRKSRAGLEFLQNKGIQPEIIDYINAPLKEDEIASLLKLFGKKPMELVRTQEDFYKKELKNKNLTDAQWIKILSENPKLIKRPIVVKGKKAVWGDPPTEINNVL
jgi:arsenate reductase (glutaredoxin)